MTHFDRSLDFNDAGYQRRGDYNELEWNTTLLLGDFPQQDWRRISQSMRDEIDGKIALLTRTRSRLDDCIGCGCMSFERCQRTNRHDRASVSGSGPRFVLAD